MEFRSQMDIGGGQLAGVTGAVAMMPIGFIFGHRRWVMYHHYAL